jgi:uncharacterized membrane protein
MSEEKTADKMEKEQKNIVNIYAALSACLIFSFIPVGALGTITAILFIGVLIAAYVMRRKAEENSLTKNHMTFVIRTIWITSFIATPTTIIAAIYLIPQLDPSPVQDCIGTALSSHNAEDDVIQNCIDAFISANLSLLIVSTLIAAALPVIYLIYRMAKGLSRAMKGHRIGNVKKWF